jgi:hypothetical protein
MKHLRLILLKYLLLNISRKDVPYWKPLDRGLRYSTLYRAVFLLEGAGPLGLSPSKERPILNVIGFPCVQAGTYL